MLNLKQGEYLVSLARRAIKNYLATQKLPSTSDAPKELQEKLGVFVTLSSFPEHELRGCIGYPLPVKQLASAAAECAVSAAVGDPRFPPVNARELEKLVIEVSVLTRPTIISTNDPRGYLAAIEIGRDGLIVENEYASGLLLPQVPVEWKWSKEEFLSHTCAKAGLPSDSWKRGEITLKKFQAQIFAEEAPSGKVSEKKI
ncbi:MAG: TIGR00296 family protein [Candidatus Micrarchaeota archaeon]